MCEPSVHVVSHDDDYDDDIDGYETEEIFTEGHLGQSCAQSPTDMDMAKCNISSLGSCACQTSSTSTTIISCRDAHVGVSSNSIDVSISSSRPHKAHEEGWGAIHSIASAKGGELRLCHFAFLLKLGSGDIGSIFLTELRHTGFLFAMKVMDKRALEARNKVSRAQMERDILQVLDHPFLPTLYAHIDDGQYSCLVMEFCPGGDLHVLRQKQPMKRLAEAAVRFYAAEVLLAVEYLHMMGIIYRDLKPENVLVRQDGHIMLTDFDLSMKCTVNPTLARVDATNESYDGGASPSPCGAACAGASTAAAACILPLGCVSPCNMHPVASCLPMPRLVQFPGNSRRRHSLKSKGGKAGENSGKGERKGSCLGHAQQQLPELHAEPTAARSMSFVGTHEYLAPEIILGEGHGSAVDWWTFGIFLFELLYGRTPFKGADHEVTLMNVVTQLLRFPSEDEFVQSPPSVDAQDLIRGLLVKDPSKRLAAIRGASEIKQHPFFAGVNWALIRCAVPPEIPSPYILPQPIPSKLGLPDDANSMHWFSRGSPASDCNELDYRLF
ncbi:hypothetical protein KP509_07G042800 [Ceratopteris richardii]|uniref:non-specific serine/threonine protein kinase n=1 Tax=Ceratopteris richardii TaxID=49495 RepID=A0A8T2UBP9_CERRI|nr:hypothetical protein KP509_07G042800 [Ceratopteris richardii]KAH7432842.1 hypothetical protein KP509_07G042800 [Ceratopteris richardii]